MKKGRNLTSSLEDYLEAIFHIINKKKAARAKDIAKSLQVNNSSVTGALRSLASKRLVNYSPYDLITLTPKGKRMAQDVVRRHEGLRNFFIKVLAVDPLEADEAACKIEHAVHRDLLDRFVRFAEYVESCPRGGAEWVEGFGYFCEEGVRREDCEKCITLDSAGLKGKIKRNMGDSAET